jgi:hypothetical protein
MHTDLFVYILLAGSQLTPSNDLFLGSQMVVDLLDTEWWYLSMCYVRWRGKENMWFEQQRHYLGFQATQKEWRQ